MKILPERFFSSADESTDLDDAVFERDCFFIDAKRHDRDRVEFQMGFDGLVGGREKRFAYDIEFVVFCPKSLGLPDVEGIDALRQEFQSYVRLHTHSSDPNSSTSQLRVLERFEKLKTLVNTESIRLFSVEFEGFTKASAKRMRKICRSPELSPAESKWMLESLQNYDQLIQNFRSFAESYAKDANKIKESAPELFERCVHDLDLLAEYISHLYVQLLGSLSIATNLGEEKAALHTFLQGLALKETAYRVEHNLMVEQRGGPDSSTVEDLYLRRISLLKKYFHKPLFVHTVGSSLQKRLLIPVYGISAALAASWAIMVHIYHVGSMGERIGINSIALISVAVLAYVAKDVMKENLRRFFFKTSTRWFPDYERKLYVSKKGKRAKLGVIKEFLRVFDSEQLPEALKKARYSTQGGEIEKSLHEDVLFFRKRVILDLSKLDTQKEFPWGLREIVRFRFDRLMTSMEDAFKKLYVLSKGGNEAARQGHRVYHIHMATWIHQIHPRFYHRKNAESMKEAFKAYRVSVDKTGVLGCERLKWKGTEADPIRAPD